MPLPEINHLQFYVLDLLMDGEKPGRALRELLAREGHRKTAAAFYQFMARCEDAGLVEGRYEPKVVDGVPIKERWYEVTGHGVNEWEKTDAFYAARRAGAKLGLLGG